MTNDTLTQQLEAHILSAREHIDMNPEQAIYWRGVLFGLETSLWEVQRQPSNEKKQIPNELYQHLSQFIFDHLDNFITLCQAGIKRDLLVYNARKVRYEVLRYLRQQAGYQHPGDYEQAADPDISRD